MYCPPMPVCRPQPAPWTYSPQFQWNPPCPPPSPSFGCGCGCPPWPQPPLTGPILGVIDGSNAPAGFVGEYVISTITVPFVGNPTDTVAGNNSLITLQPGDWDLRIWGWADVPVGGFEVAIPIQYPGFSNWFGISWWYGGKVIADPNVGGPAVYGAVRASLSQPLLVQVGVNVYQSLDATLGAGSMTVQAEARRAR